jgi:S1-C subfamily serine protease
MRTVSFLACAALWAVVSGCASMIGNDQQSLVINSEPAGAKVFLGGRELGVTPYTYTYDKADGEVLNFELRQDGYNTTALEVRPKKQSAILFADAMLLNIPYYVSDHNSKKLYSFTRPEAKVNLYRNMPEKLERKEIYVTFITSQLVAKQSLGKYSSRTITTTSDEMNALDYPEDATMDVVTGLRDGRFDAHTVRLGTQKGDEQVRQSKLYLKPALKSYHLDLEESDHLAYGSVEVEMEWQFYSGVVKDSMLFSITKRTTYPVNGERSRAVLSSALKDAARRLSEEESVFEQMGKAFDAGLVMSKGSSITLTTPTSISFTGRKDMLAALVKGVVTIETSDGHGSGFLITNDGYLMTNAHVVGEDTKVKVRFEQGFTLDGEVVKLNKDFDVALVKTPGNDLPSMAIGDDTGLQLGEEIFAIGTPLDEMLGQTVTRGIMSGRREFEGRTFIQTDVSINPGNSGGPLIDENGKVIGVATMKIRERGVQGIGFGVPITKALEMLNINFVK